MKPAPDRIRSLPIWYLMSRTFAQPAAFVLTALYIFFEYVRPQGNYPVLNILPWARFTLIGAAVASLLAGRSSLSIRGGWILITAYTGILLASIAAAVYPEAGMAKLLAARVAWSNADAGLQIHGGNGYSLEFEISRVLCDARILNIFEGAAEIQAQIIGRGLIAQVPG